MLAASEPGSSTRSCCSRIRFTRRAARRAQDGAPSTAENAALFAHGSRDLVRTLEEMEAARRPIPVADDARGSQGAAHDLFRGPGAPAWTSPRDRVGVPSFVFKSCIKLI